ncbi:MAG: DUF2523 domain-containing protein [Rugosibacter sp.]|nr:DUF2523 domain-containing protein [Rugosibacter sp.]
MANLAVWLMALVGPAAKKILVALGIGLVSYAGYSAIADQVRSAVIAQWGSIPASAVAILSIAGVGEALGIVLGAVATRSAIMAVERYAKLSS